MPTSSVNFLEELPDDLIYAVIEKLPARVIENIVRQLSKSCYRRVELRRARLPRVDIDVLHVDVVGNIFRFAHRKKARKEYIETIDPTNLIQYLEYLKERATFNILVLGDVNWEIFANCKFASEELVCFIDGTTLSPERFMDIFCSIRPTRKLYIKANGDNKIFPLTRDFFTHNHAVGLQDVRLYGYGNAMVDPFNDMILLDSTALILDGYFQTSYGCTFNEILTMIRDWYASERQIDKIDVRALG